MSFQFSNDQLTAMDKICRQLLDTTPIGVHSLAVLTGAAGTGKTTVVGEIINRIKLHSPTLEIALCATTHRAAAVLSDIVNEPVFTGHALFKLRPGVTKYGKETLKKVGFCEIPFESVVIIDEASMIGNKFLEAIVDIVRHRNLKVLFVGDPFQLPPPADTCSIFDGSLPTFQLTTVHRQLGDNPILDKATEFRQFIEGTLPIEPTLNTYLNPANEGIHILPHSKFVTKFVEKYIDYTTGAEVDVPLCTYTNESAVNYNSMVRKSAYFLENIIEPFYTGERLIANSVVMEGDKTILTNNEVVHVIEYLETEQYNIPGYLVSLQGDYNKYTKSNKKRVFSPKTTAAANKILDGFKAIAIKNSSKENWTNFYKIKNALADLRPPFAGTTHKAQGGTFPAVFIDKININKCRDPQTRARLFYVALTRATTNVYINS
jgi:exodeoxyribonuclease-5|tara:strand:+ start:1012 stop:2310 length:1299 start_codon:yes stop_codon:yes gene_type:complete